jgi:NADP-dependent 3-hydroxy acid dehydrogenase YdfG
MEVAKDGVRVLSAMLGKTATPMQERIQLARSGAYDPGLFPSAADVAELIVSALALPPNAELTEFSLRPQYEGPR